MLGERLSGVRDSAPIVHCITNYVTANDCANILLACGASPIMADDESEAEEITALCSGLVLNIGTLDRRKIPSMLAAGSRAKALGHPVVLDPVGAGASKLRTETALRLLREVRPDIIRGNMSEIKTLALGGGDTRGVDAAVTDRVSEENLAQAVSFAKRFALDAGAAVAVTGTVDIVTDGNTAYCIRNGCAEMSRVTGTGCQLSALCGAFAAANKENILEAVAAAVCMMGLCGEAARARLGSLGGSASLRNYIIDAAYNMTAEQLDRGAKYEVQ